MKEVTIKIPDGKYQFFMELVRNLGFENIEDSEISEKHKAIVIDRIKKSRSEDLIPWQEARKQLRFKNNS